MVQQPWRAAFQQWASTSRDGYLPRDFADSFFTDDVIRTKKIALECMKNWVKNAHGGNIPKEFVEVAMKGSGQPDFQFRFAPQRNQKNSGTPYITLSEEGTVATVKNQGCCAVACKGLLSSGKHTFTVRIEHQISKHYSHFRVGYVTADNGFDWDGTGCHTLGQCCSASMKSGYAYITDANKRHSGSQSSYGTKWTIGDVITSVLDIEAKTIEFLKNGQSQGVAYTGVTSNSGFWAAVSMYNPGDKVRILESEEVES